MNFCDQFHPNLSLLLICPRGIVTVRLEEDISNMYKSAFITPNIYIAPLLVDGRKLYESLIFKANNVVQDHFHVSVCLLFVVTLLLSVFQVRVKEDVVMLDPNSIYRE